MISMKTIIIINTFLLVLSITGCGSSDDASTLSPSDTLLGDWSYTYPNQCVETNTYSSTNVWSGSALDERQTGTYIFTENNSGGKHSLSVNITSDNGLPDCNGVSAVTLGSTAIAFVVFLSNTTMELYRNESDTTAYVTVTKN